jgi:1-deoxy-D-xylulose-5-phosphate synthase
MTLPARFIDQAKPHDMYDDAELNAPHIVKMALSALGQDLAEAPARA